MQQTLVYRLEDEDGYGPFQSEAAREAIDAERYNADRWNFPTPVNDLTDGGDSLNDYIEDHWGWDRTLCIGCPSPESLQHWFDADACSALSELGYALTVWRCPPEGYAEARFQAVFDRDLAECIERHPACALWAASQQLQLPLAA